jgi:hypothetical protein
VAIERGGTSADTANLVSLVKEMRAAFGTRYGISMTLAPDYWYLRYFDPYAMQEYVDWFGFMGGRDQKLCVSWLTIVRVRSTWAVGRKRQGTRSVNLYS